MNMGKALKTKQYGNWEMRSPTGELMSRCDDKRAKWYLKRGLAVLDGENVIKLTFPPAGKGNINNAFLLEDKDNCCVVCGRKDDLNRHHVVPYQYRKWFPLQYKSKSSYDVLPICIDHHEEYEDFARERVLQLATEYDAPYNKKVEITEDQRRLVRARGFAHVLNDEPDQIPEDRRLFMQAEVRAIFGDLPLTEIVSQERISQPPLEVIHGQVVVEKVLERDELQVFIEGWREHFVMTMEPQFLSKNWSIHHVHESKHVHLHDPS